MTEVVKIVDIDQDGRGVAKIGDKVLFLHNAMLDEQVEFDILKKKKNILFGRAITINNPSPDRVNPLCKHYNHCGGCAMQHFSEESQIEFKNKSFFHTLKNLGQVEPDEKIKPIFLEFTGYRHKARLRVKYVARKDEVLVGFNERLTHFLTDMHECKVLPEKISNLITPLRNLIRQLSIYNKLPQIEFASNQERDILIFRILEELNESDIVLLKSFQEKNEIEVWTQSKGPETVKPLFENINPKVSYILRKRNLEISFNPSGFIQINPFINELMIEKALDLLEPKNEDIIIDFFSGLGNFTLPIAQNAKNVIGIEGSEVLVELGKLNAKNNNLKNVVFTFADLFKIDENFYESIKHANKWLLDPPRDGAMALIQGMPDHIRPKRIIYVSCNAATLARDANILTSKGYNYQSAGILNMFPNTSHIESISMFELNE